MENNNTFKPFAVGDRVISEADGPGTVTHLILGAPHPIKVLFDSGFSFSLYQNGQMYAGAPDSAMDIRHMTAEEQSQFPKPE